MSPPSRAGLFHAGSASLLSPKESITIADEGAPLEDQGDDVAEGVMPDAITIGRGGDQASLGFDDLEGALGAGLISLGAEFRVQLEQFMFELVVKGKDVRAGAFAALGLAGGSDEVSEVYNAGPEIAMTFHGDSC